MTAVIQIQPKPFKNAANEQRPFFEKWRSLSDEEIIERREEYHADMARGREFYERAWREWIDIGGEDVRITSPDR